MAVNFKNGFSSAVAKGQKVWAHDRQQTAGASEVFGCWRELYFKKRAPELAEDPEEEDPEWGHTERGNLIENEFAVPCLRDMFGKDRCFYMGDEQKTFVDGRLSATPDGVITDLERDALVEYGVEDIGEQGVIGAEVKTFGGEYAAPKKFKGVSLVNPGEEVIYYKPKPRHEGQGHVQMGLLRRKTNYQPDYVAALYINPSNLKDIRVGVVKYDDKVYQRAKERAEAVFDPDKEAKDFPTEGKLRNDCTYCKFVSACAQTDAERFTGNVRKPKEFTDAELETFFNAVKKVAELRANMKDIELEKKEAEFELREMLLDANTSRMGGEGWSASLSQNGGRKKLDAKRLAEDSGLDPEDYMIEGNPYFVLRTKFEDIA